MGGNLGRRIKQIGNDAIDKVDRRTRKITKKEVNASVKKHLETVEKKLADLHVLYSEKLKQIDTLTSKEQRESMKKYLDKWLNKEISKLTVELQKSISLANKVVKKRY